MDLNRKSQINLEISQLLLLAHSRFGISTKKESDEEYVKRQIEIYVEIDRLRNELKKL